MTGVCGLCRQRRELQESHLLPRAVYRHLRDPTIGSNPDPVIITPKKSMISSRQATAFLLCWECEQRFRQKGEDHILTQCAHHDGQFRLRERLQAASPVYTAPRFMVYDAVLLLGHRIASYLYFAASVFWRAAAYRRWRVGTESVTSISLGTTYQEQFRLYLLDQAPFPANARIRLHIASEAYPDVLTLAFPSSTRVNGVHRHKVYINGLIFVLFLGQEVPYGYHNGALNSRQPCIWLSSWSEDSLFLANVRMAGTSTPVGGPAQADIIVILINVT